MKKLATLFLLMSALSFGSEYKYYKKATLEQCAEKLSELSRCYEIIDYKVFPTRWDNVYDMIIEVEGIK